MAFGEDETITIWPGRIGRVMLHDVEIQSDKRFHGRKRSARMAGFGRANHFNDMTADLFRDGLQFFQAFFLVHDNNLRVYHLAGAWGLRRGNGCVTSSSGKVVRQIPKGKVATYGQVAAAAGYPGYHRQVAQMLSKSGDALPWQRVVGAGGQLRLQR